MRPTDQEMTTTEKINVVPQSFKRRGHATPQGHVGKHPGSGQEAEGEGGFVSKAFIVPSMRRNR